MVAEESTQKLIPATDNVDDRFDKSLKELRELRSQLHHAADRCEAAFKMSTERKKIIDNTKEYISKSIVTVVDHLGNVADKLECSLHGTVEVSEGEQKIDCMGQRLLSWQQCSLTLQLSSFSHKTMFPKHVPHYIAPFQGADGVENSSGAQRCKDDGTKLNPSEAFGTDEELVIKKLFTDYVNPKIPNFQWNSGIELCKAVEVKEGPSILSKPSDPRFGSRAEVERIFEKENQNQKKRPMNSNYFFSILRKSKKVLEEVY